MIAIVRIAGRVGIRQEIAETLDRLRLRRKFVCAVYEEKPEIIGMVKKVKDFVAYGKIDEEFMARLLAARGKKKDGKSISEEEAKKIAKEFFAGKKLEELGVKPFFRLHPPRGGIDSKHHYPKGVLGKHDNIKELIERML